MSLPKKNNRNDTYVYMRICVADLFGAQAWPKSTLTDPQLDATKLCLIEILPNYDFEI